MFNKEKIIYCSGVILTVIILILFQFFLYSKGFYSISADEAGHTLEGFNWYKGQTYIFSIWLPFQKILYGLAFYIYDNLIWVPRILSSLFGILTLLALIFLTDELYHNKIVSLISGFLASIFWGLVIFSVLPLAEIYFFFFEITSIALLLHWKRTNNVISLWFTIILSGISCTIRYEAWIFSFFVFISIIINIYSTKKKLGNLILKTVGITIVLFSFPLVWIYLNYITGSANNFINSVPGRYSRAIALSELTNNVIYLFLSINFKSLNILGFIALFYHRKNSEIKLYGYIIISTLLSMSIILFITKANMPSHNTWRLASIWSILLIPLTAQWLYILFSDENRFFKYNSAVFFLILIYFFNNQIMDYSKESYMNKEDIIAGEYINYNLKFANSTSKIFIEQNGWKYTSLLITSQMPDRFITDKEFFYNSGLTPTSVEKELFVKFDKSNIEYLILKSNTQLFRNLSYLQEIKKIGNWGIYKLP